VAVGFGAPTDTVDVGVALEGSSVAVDVEVALEAIPSAADVELEPPLDPLSSASLTLLLLLSLLVLF